MAAPPVTPPTAPYTSPAPAPAPFASASLYVGELHPDVTEALLFDLFKQVGPVASIRVCRDAITRRSLGYAYINFHSVGDADRALDTLNYAPIAGKPCRIMWSHRDPAKRKSGLGNVFIKNLDKSIDHQNVYDTFSDFGNILSCKVELDEAGESRGYGYVHYETEEEADSAIAKVNGMILAGRVVSVSKFKPKKEREREIQSNFTNVFVKNLPNEFNDQQLRELFANYGEIQSCVLGTDAVKPIRVKKQPIEQSENAPEEPKDAAAQESEEKPSEEESADKSGENSEENQGEEKVSSEGQGGNEEEQNVEFRTFGFINFGNSGDARRAVDEMNGHEVQGVKIFVGRAQKKAERQQELKQLWEQRKLENLQKYQGVNLYVKNLDDSVTKETLRKEFAHCGDITSTTVMRDDKENSRGFGFVCFSSPEEATKAVTEMNGTMLNGKPIYVALAQRKDVRKAQLEQQHAQRAQSGIRMQPNMGGMYPNAPMFYGGVGVPGVGQRVMYQPNMVARQRWQGGPQVAGRQQYGQPQVMPGGYPQVMVPNGGRGGRGGAAGGRGGRGGANPKAGAGARNQGPIPGQGGVHQSGGRGAPKGYPQTRNQPFQPPNAAGVQSLTSLPSVQDLAANPEEAKDMLGERLYLSIYKTHPVQAGKVTGMILEYMDVPELINLLEDEQVLQSKVGEALNVLKSSETELEKEGEETVAEE